MRGRGVQGWTAPLRERAFHLWWDLAWLKPVLQKWAIVGCVLVGAAAVGWLAAKLKQPEVLLAVLALPVLFKGVGQLRFGILGIVLAAAVVRVSIPTGTKSRLVVSLVLTAVIVVAWVAQMLVQDKRLWLTPVPTNVPLLGFIAATVISFFWSNVFRDPLVVVWKTWPFVQLGGLAVMVLLPGAFLLVSNNLLEEKWLHWLTIIMIAVGAVAITGYYLRLPVHFLQVRPLFPTWFICLALSMALFNRRLPWSVRLLLLMLTGAWAFRVFVREFRWLSAWMPSAAAVSVISVLRSRKTLLLIMILALLYVGTHLDSIVTELETERQRSGETRLDAYLHNWRVTGKHLLFGVGPAGYAAYYMSYFPLEAMATHSTYLDILSQTGIVGLFFYLWFFAALLKSGLILVWRLWGRSNFAEAFAIASLGGCVGAILAMALGDWIVPFVYTQTIAGFDYAVYTWVLLGGMMSLYYTVVVKGRENA